MKVAYVLFFLTSLSYVYGETDSAVDERIKALSMSRQSYWRVRCTRRYSAGNCLDSVRPVWTYVPHLQTCVERLGCAAGYFGNRFNSLEECLSSCRDLIYLFMYLQSADHNSSFRIPDQVTDGRRLDTELKEGREHEWSSDEVVDDTDEEVQHYDDESLSQDGLKKALRNLPDVDSDSALEHTTEARDYHQPKLGRQAMGDDRFFVLPDIDDF